MKHDTVLAFVGLVMVGVFMTSVKAGRIVRWIPSTNFDSPLNWNTGQIPCHNQRVRFPDTAPSVYIQHNLTTLELVLPNNGELILGDGVLISVVSSPSVDSSCREQDATYVGQTARSWFDPNNWCDVSDISGDCLNTQPDLLDVERLPCQLDTVAFPSNAQFLVSLGDSVDIQIGKLSLSSQDYTTQTFRSFLESASGKKQFVRSPGVQKQTSVTVKGQTCSEETGCECGNEPLKRLVCSQTLPCGNVTCNGELSVDGNCCTFCGALLLLDYGAGTRLKPIDNLVKNTYMQLDDKPGMKLILSKSKSDHIQILISDEDGGTRSRTVAMSVKEQLETDIKSKKRYGITDVSLTVSGDPIGPTVERHTDAPGAGNIVLIIFGILVVLVALLLAIYCTRTTRRPLVQYIPRSFSELLHRDRASDVNKRTLDNMELPVMMFDNSVIFESNDGFDNPNYNLARLGGGLETQPQRHVAGMHEPVYSSSPQSFSITPPFNDESFPPVSSKKSLDTKPPRQQLKDVDQSLASKFGQTFGMKRKQKEIDEGSGSNNNNEKDERPEIDSDANRQKKKSKAKKNAKAEVEPSEIDITTKDPEIEENPDIQTPPVVAKHQTKLPFHLPKFGKSNVHSKLEADLDSSDEEKGGREREGKSKEWEDDGDAGFGNPMYSLDDSVQPPKWEVKDEAAIIDDNRSGFANPLFDEKKTESDA